MKLFTSARATLALGSVLGALLFSNPASAAASQVPGSFPSAGQADNGKLWALTPVVQYGRDSITGLGCWVGTSATCAPGSGVAGNVAYTPADASSTVTVGGTFQQVFASNASRVNCFIQNPTSATEPLLVHWTSASATVNNSAYLGPGSSFSCAGNNTVVTGAIQVTATTNGHLFIANGS